MENISKYIGVCKFTFFFLLISMLYVCFSFLPVHEQVHQAVFKSFGINSTISYDWKGGYTTYDTLLCPNTSQCYKTQMAIESLKPKNDNDILAFMTAISLLTCACEIAYALIKHRRDGSSYEKDKLNRYEIDRY